MIRGYSDHAANERTFLAWVRTGIAMIALGFVIEKFNLFVLTVASSTSAEVAHRLQLEKLSSPLGRYGGHALIFRGLALIVAATAASSAPGDCSMTLRCTPPAAYAPS